jgi:5-methylcytosine-specific restriction enzyme A
VRALDNDGAVLDAEYQVETDDRHLALIMESRSGASGSRPPRNPDYNRALVILLSRLGSLDAVLVDALVDSRQTRELGLPEGRRRLAEMPIRLAKEADMDALRRRMGTAQAKIGQAPDATKGGNATKRIRLRLDVPNYQPSDAALLANSLATATPNAAPSPTFILTWNPDRWTWPPDEYARAIQVTEAGGTWREDWSVGLRTGGVRPGDQAMLLRQRRDRGLVASGVFMSGLDTAEHWDGTGRPTRYGQIKWDTVLEVEDRLPVEQLKLSVPGVTWDRIQGSGVAVPSSAIRALSELWASHTGKLIFHSPDEPHSAGEQTFPEGALTRVEVNRYERDRRARKTCLDHWGYRCAACGFSFQDRYGPLGQDFIHVHHTVELSLVPPDYQVDPIADLRPVCPNCHAMLHRTRPAMTRR